MDYKINIANELAGLFNVTTQELLPLIEIPPDKKMGDYALPCFRFAKEYKKAPQIISSEISPKINCSGFIEKAEPLGGYINIWIKKPTYAKTVIEAALKEAEGYGGSDIGTGKNVVLDYSSPNIAKPFHVGHLRSTVIGNALYNIYKKLGYNCTGINYLGDWGTQFGKLITAYKNWGTEEEVEKGEIKELNRLYVHFHEEAEKDKSLEEDARGNMLKMQKGDEESISLWKWFQTLSMKEFEKIYDKLNVKFDLYQGESYYNDKMDAVVEELKEKSLLQTSEGAQIVDLSEFNMPPCLILRRDGGTLYPTRDLAAAMDREKTYNAERYIYVTAFDQSLHFAQFFKVLEKMGYRWSEKLVHVPFGLVMTDSGKVATRRGNTVLIEEILDEAVEKTIGIINEKNANLINKEEVAKEVGVGAIIFNDLYNGRIKDVQLSWEKMLNFDGETGPYVQYTHARANSVLQKAGEVDFTKINFDDLSDEFSVDVIKVIESYPSKIFEAAEKYEPSILTRHLVSLSQEFNRFYHNNSILNCDDDTKIARLALTKVVKTVLFSGLKILGISAPEQM